MEDSCKNTSVYVIDDELLICDILCEMINSIQGCSVAGGSTSGMIALKDITEKKPDIVLLDLKLNNENGFDLVRAIKNIRRETRIFILSGYFNKTLVGQAIKSGASGYLTKNLGIEEIKDAIKNAAVSSSFYLPPGCGIKIDDLNKEKKLYPNQYAVTKREKEILLLIAKEFSTREISEKLGISEKTVRNHKSHMMQKLNIKSDAGLVKYAYYMAII